MRQPWRRKAYNADSKVNGVGVGVRKGKPRVLVGSNVV